MSGAPRPVQLEEVFAGLRITQRGLGVLSLCIFMAMSEGYDVQVMALAAPLLARSWELGPPQIGVLLTASVLGIVLGSILLAPIGDRFGRRPSALAGVLTAAVFTTAGAFAPDMQTLLATRLLAGLGLGLAMPNVIAIAMETASATWRTLVVVAVSCGYPLGAGFGGAIASAFAADHGHAAVFLVGGAPTALAAALGALWLPESPFHLAKDPAQAPRLRRLLQSLGAPVSEATAFAAPARPPTSTVAALFTSERRATTTLLWVMNFANIAMVYFLISWLPSLLTYRGLSGGAALIASSIFNAAGVLGGLSMALAMRPLGPTAVLGWAYVLAGAGVLALGLLPGAGPSMLFAIGVAGVGVVGSQFCLTAVVNHYYPPEIRVSAAGYALGVGRLGAVVAPMTGAMLLSVVAAVGQAFIVTAVPAAVALLAVLTLRRFGTIANAA